MRVLVSDPCRWATFDVVAYSLRGVAINATLPGEADAVASLLLTPIDPDLLRDAQTVAEALGLIAVNASNMACARLSYIYCTASGRMPPQIASSTLASVHRPAVGPAAFACGMLRIGSLDEQTPSTLDSLPASVLTRVACFTGCLNSAQALASCSHALHTAMSADDEARLMALPIWSDVRAECPRCFAIDPRADGPLLTRTARPGHGLVAVGAHSVLRERSALLEIELTSLPLIGGVQLGVAAVLAVNGGQAVGAGAASPSAHDQLWFDLCGRLSVGANVAGATPLPLLYGERLRLGDRVGILFDARTCSVALVRAQHGAGESSTLNVLGPLVPLRRPTHAHEKGGGKRLSDGRAILGYRFVMCFDWCAGLAVRVAADRRHAVHVGTLVHARGAPRPLAPDEPPLLVRTLGPDAHNVGVHLCLETATVGQLRGVLTTALEVENGQQVEVRCAVPVHDVMGSAVALKDDEATLADCGVVADPSTGVHGCVLYLPTYG